MNAAWNALLVLCFTLCTWVSHQCALADTAAGATAARAATLLALARAALAATTTLSASTPPGSNCTSGWFSVSGVEPCAKCRAGFFQPSAGATTCLACPNGTFSAAASATECRDCGAGTFSNGSACVVCPQGYFNANKTHGVASCAACPDGKYTAEPAPLPRNRVNCSDCGQGERCTGGFQVSCGVWFDVPIYCACVSSAVCNCCVIICLPTKPLTNC